MAGKRSRSLITTLLLALPFSASAVIGVDSSGKTTGAVVYAKETLSKSSTIEKDGETYYVVSESNRIVETGGNIRLLELDTYTPFLFARPASSNMVVDVTLEGMVLGRNLDLGDSSSVTSYGQFELRYGNLYSAKKVGLTYTLLSGGQRGDSSIAVGITTGSSTTIGTTDSLYISFGQLGILPDTPGTIRVAFSYEFAGQNIEEEHVMRDAVKAMNLLEVSSTASNATVDVSGEGTRFQAGTNVRDDGLAANVGRVKADAAMTFTGGDPYYPPFIHPGDQRVLAASGALIIDSAHSLRTTSPYYTGPGGTTYEGTVSPPSGTLQSILGSSASVEMEGETGFLGDDGKVFVSSSSDCSPTADSLVEDDGITAPLSSFAGNGGYVCIEVDGETPIPETMPYRATVKHESTTAAFPFPENERVLGRIGFGGSTVRIPYLTTNDSYNQRIVAVNRSGRPASYTLTFQPSTDTDTVATPEDAATGTFPAGRTILLVRDVVTLEDGDHTAATLSIVAPPDKVDVATVLTNRNDGSTDSVVYDAE